MKPLFFLTLISLFWMGGCGSNLTEEKTSDTASSYIARSIDTQAKKNYGYLANATVNIYELTDGKKELLFSEKTTTGNELTTIGNFKSHFESLRPNRYYQIEVFGGEDWDINEDNIKDATPTANTKHFRAIYKGHTLHTNWWQTATTGNKASGER